MFIHWGTFMQSLLQWKSNKHYKFWICVTLVIQHAMCMHHIILSSVACLALPYISTLSHKWHDFQKKLLNVRCVFWFPLQHLSETFLILRRSHWGSIINGHMLSCKVPVILVRFYQTWIFSTDFLKMNVCIVGVDLFHVDRWTDRQTR
jgi:hypothetical protein